MHGLRKGLRNDLRTKKVEKAQFFSSVFQTQPFVLSQGNPTQSFWISKLAKKPLGKRVSKSRLLKGFLDEQNVYPILILVNYKKAVLGLSISYFVLEIYSQVHYVFASEFYGD